MPEDVTRVDKPWGYELHWAKTDRYVGKLIHVDAGHALSLQYHNKKDETIFLWAGRLLFEIQEQGKLVKREMKLGESVHITPGTVHRMTAIDDCDIFEVSTPELDDVVRLEDRYGRRRRASAVSSLHAGRVMLSLASTSQSSERQRKAASWTPEAESVQHRSSCSLSTQPLSQFLPCAARRRADTGQFRACRSGGTLERTIAWAV